MFRQRSGALVIVLLAHALLMLLLLRLTPPPGGPTSQPVTAIELIPEPVTRTQAKAEAKPERVVTQPTPRRVAVPPPRPPAERYELDIIRLTPEEYAAADIARMPSRTKDAATADAESASAETVGTGPNGERLYKAEWYREPTQAELSYYLRDGAPAGGWATIACQTIANYRVDNCVELDQWPPGSGLAGAIREAAWQFRVWPPRIGGRPLVGAWVRIRIEFMREPGR